MICLGFGPLFGSGSRWEVLLFLCAGLAVMGLTYGPIGASLAGQFPTAVRYTGASLAFNLAGIIGASAAPYIATWLAALLLMGDSRSWSRGYLEPETEG